MKAIFKLLDDGGFVAGDADSHMTSYAYPTSPHAKVAKKHPKAVAEEMLSHELVFLHATQSGQAYDRKNWELLGEVQS